MPGRPNVYVPILRRGAVSTMRGTGEAMKRLRAMRADPAWQEARAIPAAHKQERREAFSNLRHMYGFSEYALHEFAKEANCAWIADHIDRATATACS